MGTVALQQAESETMFVVSVYSRSTQMMSELLEPEELMLTLVVAGGERVVDFRITEAHGEPDPTYSYTRECNLPIDRATVLALLAVRYSWTEEAAAEASTFGISQDEVEEIGKEVSRRHEIYVEEMMRWSKKRIWPVPRAPWDIG
jgi:hypothetical protein